MSPLGLQVRHLEMLEALLIEQHVGRAADRLALSQPAISNALARMRLHFHDELLVRQGSRMMLTPFANRLRDEVEHILHAIRVLAAARPGFDPAETDRTFRIAMPPHIGALVMPVLIQLITTEAPAARVDCVSLSGAWDRLQSGALDAALANEDMVPPILLRQIVLADHWRCLVARSQVFETGGPTSADFATMRLVLPTGEMQRTMPQLAESGRPVAAVPIEMMPYVVAESDAAAVVPASFAQFYQLFLPLVSYPLPFATPTIRCAMAWPAQQQHDPAALWFRDKVMAAAAPATARLTGLTGGA